MNRTYIYFRRPAAGFAPAFGQEQAQSLGARLSGPGGLEPVDEPPGCSEAGSARKAGRPCRA